MYLLECLHWHEDGLPALVTTVCMLIHVSMFGSTDARIMQLLAMQGPHPGTGQRIEA